MSCDYAHFWFWKQWALKDSFWSQFRWQLSKLSPKFFNHSVPSDVPYFNAGAYKDRKSNLGARSQVPWTKNSDFECHTNCRAPSFISATYIIVTGTPQPHKFLKELTDSHKIGFESFGGVTFEFAPLGGGTPLIWPRTSVVWKPWEKYFGFEGNRLPFGYIWGFESVHFCLQCSDAVGWAAGRASGL